MGKSPFAVIYDPVDGLLYVLEVNGKSRMLVVLNALTGQPVTTVNVGPSPTSLAAIGNKTFVTNGAQTTVTVVSFTPSPLKRVTSTTVATASTSPTVSTTQYSTPPVQTGVPTAPPSPFSVIPLTDIIIAVVIVIVAVVALIVIRTRFLGR